MFCFLSSLSSFARVDLLLVRRTDGHIGRQIKGKTNERKNLAYYNNLGVLQYLLASSTLLFHSFLSSVLFLFFLLP